MGLLLKVSVELGLEKRSKSQERKRKRAIGRERERERERENGIDCFVSGLCLCHVKWHKLCHNSSTWRVVNGKGDGDSRSI